jgi:hypothetical protein
VLHAGAGQARGRLQPVQPWLGDVHQDDVGAAAAGDLDRCEAVPGVAHDLEVGLVLEDGAEAAADDRLVVG